MSSIRNLSGAPSFGSSALDAGGGKRRSRSHTADGEMSSSLSSRTFSQLGSFASSTGDGRANRRSMYAAFHAGGSQHHVSGEVTGPNQSFSYRPHYNISTNYNIADASFKSSATPPLSKTPSPPSGRLRKLRSSTWDSSGMGRLSHLTRLSKNDSPGSAASGESANGITAGQKGQAGEKVSEATKLVFDDDEVELSSFEGDNENLVFDDDEVELSSSEGDSENNDETETEDMHVMELQGSLLSAAQHEVIFEEDDVSGSSSDVEINFAKDQADETKCGNLKGSSSLSMKSENSKSGKGVTFAEDGSEHDEERDARARPSFCAKLPALTRWDKSDEDEGSGVVGSPTAGQNSKASTHFQRQTSEPSILAKLNPFGDLSWSLIGSFIVRTAPCFWCSKKLGISATDREILLRLNLICAFFCVIQICSGIFIFLIQFTGYVEDDENELASEADEDKPLISADLWSLQLFVYSISVVAFVLLVASMVAQRAIREVNLVGSVRYMWVLFWLLPILIFCMIGLFDPYAVNEVHTKHWWDDPSMKTSREICCEPGTANDKCKVPILGGIDYDNEEEWCRTKYDNSTDCEAIRDGAQGKYIAFVPYVYSNCFCSVCI